MKVSDYAVQTLVDAGICECFSVVGGASMHLNDSFAKHPDIRVTYMAHENACVNAAESYFRLTGKLACVCVIAGPGSLNCVNGVHAAYVDGQGLIVISGQCDSRTINQGGLRQLGDQEVNICSVVESITKYVMEIGNVRSIRFCLEKALHEAISGRPGPVWLTIPVDMQNADVDPEFLGHSEWTPPAPPPIDYTTLLDHLSRAKRPVIVAGSGIRTSNAVKEFRELVDVLGVPVVTAFNGHDLIPSGHPLYVGRQGTIGDIAGNLAVQNADLLLILGSRMNIRSIGFNFDAFSPDSFKIQVDIDEAEMIKPFPKIDMGIHADLKTFLGRMNEMLSPGNLRWVRNNAWHTQCKEWRAKYPVVKPEYRDTPMLSPYVFIEQLFDQLREDDIVVCANGTATVATFQAAKIKDGQRLYTNGGSASMGWGIPAAIGAARGAKPGQRVICIEGDGSLQMCVGELATIAHENLNIIVFVLSNSGYVSIRQTQDRFFEGRHAGIDENSGVGFPDLLKLADAYGISFGLVDYEGWWSGSLPDAGPALVEVYLDPAVNFAPRIRFPMEQP